MAAKAFAKIQEAVGEVVVTLQAPKEARKMPWTPAPSAPRCPACREAVYPAESVMACDRTPFHKSCHKCKSCHKLLTPSTRVADPQHQTQLYCKPCYEIVFNMNEYTSDTYGGIVTPEDLLRAEEEEQKKLQRAERAKRERRCPACDMKAYPADAVQMGEMFYHKACLKCTECGRGPDNDTPMMLGPKETAGSVFGQEEDLEPYCKFCFAKKYNLSALNIQDMVTTLVDMAQEEETAPGL